MKKNSNNSTKNSKTQINSKTNVNTKEKPPEKKGIISKNNEKIEDKYDFSKDLHVHVKDYLIVFAISLVFNGNSKKKLQRGFTNFGKKYFFLRKSWPYFKKI